MKTTLPTRSLVIKERLDAIVKEILAAAKDKIAMIILFGSYARGDWVQQEYMEGHITYIYQSDLDILLVLRNMKFAGYRAIRLKHQIENRLKRKSLTLTKIIARQPSVTLILEPINNVNEMLRKGQYFFTDVKKEGILLYDSGEFQIAEAKELPWEERRKTAEEDYEYWFARGKRFLMLCKTSIEMDDYPVAAFLLHQATESFYHAILLVFTGYKPKLHDISVLGERARIYNDELFKTFPCATPEQEECFELLKIAYTEARYNKEYKIAKEQLLYLIERVEKLKEVTEKICLERINKKNKKEKL